MNDNKDRLIELMTRYINILEEEIDELAPIVWANIGWKSDLSNKESLKQQIKELKKTTNLD